jgi:hypothetical protein
VVCQTGARGQHRGDAAELGTQIEANNAATEGLGEIARRPANAAAEVQDAVIGFER